MIVRGFICKGDIFVEFFFTISLFYHQRIPGTAYTTAVGPGWATGRFWPLEPLVTGLTSALHAWKIGNLCMRHNCWVRKNWIIIKLHPSVMKSTIRYYKNTNEHEGFYFLSSIFILGILKLKFIYHYKSIQSADNFIYRYRFMCNVTFIIFLF